MVGREAMTKREEVREPGCSWEDKALMSQDELMMVGDGGRSSSMLSYC